RGARGEGRRRHGRRARRARVFARRGTTPAAALAAALSIGAVVAVTAWGDHAPDGGPAVGTVATAAVQGGGARGFSKSEIRPSVVLAAQFGASRLLRGRRSGPPSRLVLWPEDVVSLDTLLSDSPVEGRLAGLARSLHAALVVGVTETVSGTTFRNEVVAFGPDGAV